MSIEEAKQENKWACTICHTNENFPLMIIICGHTFCEVCLNKLTNCPLCRVKFNYFDCQPNYSLAKNSGSPMVKREINIDQQIADIVRFKKAQVRSQTNMIFKRLIDQLNQKLIEEPMRLTYNCDIEAGVDQDVLNLIQDKFTNYGISIEFKQLDQSKISANIYFQVKTRKPKPVLSESLLQTESLSNGMALYDLLLSQIPPGLPPLVN